MSESSVMQIQQRLTCPVCLERYKSPKLLPCQHTFCLSPCLTNLVDNRTRLIKCPECRSIHHVPIDGGVQAFPNNITILRFLDLNLTKSSFVRSFADKCSQCQQKADNIGKCLDCEKLYCEKCRPLHLAQLKNETRTAILSLRKILPKLSMQVGNFEQKKENLTQNNESIKREITSMIDRLIEDLKNREKCLHAEAEVYMQTQMRTIRLEKENAEIELASVTSFCDNTEHALNRSDENGTSVDNEIALVKKQCINFIEQTKNYDENLLELIKMSLRVTDLMDLSNYIKNFGSLTVQNVLKNNINVMESIENTEQQPNQQARRTWNRNVNIDQLSLFSARTTTATTLENENFTDRSLIDPIHIQSTPARQLLAPLPRPVGFNITYSNSNPNRRLVINTNETTTVPEEPTQHSVLLRSDTFVLESSTDQSQQQQQQQTFEPSSESASFSQTRRLDSNNEVNGSRIRRLRTRTPLTFNVMLNETNQAVPFDYNDSSVIYSSVTPSMPSIDYSSKTSAKLIFGKKGKGNGDLIWPCDVSVNQFNNQIIVSDSGNNRVQIFDSNGRFIKKFGAQGNELGQFNSLSGIFIDSMAYIYSTDRLNHRSVRSIGCGPGALPGQLNFPLGICVNRISEIFVCDKENDRVCVFHSSGKFLRSFGRTGSREGEFDKPCFVHITRENLILISDSSNHRIQVFDSNGNFQLSFGSEGSHQGQFKHPRGISQDGEGFILVADSGNSRIQIFRPNDYSYVSEFGSAGSQSGEFMGIEGIQISLNGEIIVCDRENHRVQIF